MTQYEINLPRVDNSKSWSTIRIFDTKEEAVKFCNQTWDIEDGLLCLVTQDGDEWVVDVPNPNYTSTNNQFLNVEGFHHEADAIDFAIENYQADKEGCVNLISEVD